MNRPCVTGSYVIHLSGRYHETFTEPRYLLFNSESSGVRRIPQLYRAERTTGQTRSRISPGVCVVVQLHPVPLGRIVRQPIHNGDYT